MGRLLLILRTPCENLKPTARHLLRTLLRTFHRALRVRQELKTSPKRQKGEPKRFQLRPEGRNRRCDTRLKGPEVLGPLGGLGIRPLVSVIRGSETPSQRPLRAPERLSGPRGRLFRGLGEVCSFSTERENKVGHSEAPKRSHFPGCPPEGVPTLGLLPSGHR